MSNEELFLRIAELEQQQLKLKDRLQAAEMALRYYKSEERKRYLITGFVRESPADFYFAEQEKLK